MEDMKKIKHALVEFVETHLDNLDSVDTREMGEIIDMIKDVSEAIYYCTTAKAMDECGEMSSEKIVQEVIKMSPHFTEGEKQQIKNIMNSL